MKLVLIDADSLIYSVCFGAFNQFKNKTKTEDNLGDYREHIDDWIKDIITKNEATHYLGFITIGKVFRHTVAKNKEYKSGRLLDKPKFFYEIRKHLIDNWQFKYCDGLEAEDLVAVCLKHFTNEFTRLSYIDHDLKQLCAINYNYKKDTHEVISLDESEYNLWKQVLTGCSTDCVEGIPGIGDKKADKLLEGVAKENYKHKVLDCYIQHFGLCKGIDLFNETFKLVYLLRSIEEIKQMIGVDYEIPTPIEYKKELTFNIEDFKP